MESLTNAELLAELAVLRSRTETFERRQRELTALLEAQQTITSSLELEESLQAIVRHAAAIGDKATVWLFILEPEQQLLRCCAATRFAAEEMASLALAVGQGMSGQVALTRQPVAVLDMREDLRAAVPPELVVKYGLVSYLGIPIVFADQLLGVLAISSSCPRTHSADEVALLTTFATQAAIAIANARLYEDAQRQRREAEVRDEIGRRITASLDLDRILQQVVDGARELCASDFAEIFLWDAPREGLVVRYSAGLRHHDLTIPVVKPGKGIGGLVLETSRPFRTDNYAEDPRFSKEYLSRSRAEAVVAELAMPIRIDDRVEGVLFASNRSPRAFTDRDEATLVRLADYAAIALKNAGLFEAARRELGERGRAEMALRASEDRYRRITQAVTDYICTVRVEDGRPTETHHGPGCVAVTGYTGEELAADRDLWIRMVDGADREAVLEQARRILAGEDAPTIEHRIVRKDGARRWVRNTPVLYRDARGMLLSYDGLIQDVTERKQAEAALLARTQQLEAVRAISEEITRELDLGTLLDLITRRAVELVGSSSGMLRLWDETAQVLTPQSRFGIGAQRRALTLRLGEGVAGTVAQQRKGLIVNDFRASPYATPELLEVTTHTAVLGEPLLYRDGLIGVITINREEYRPYTEEDRQLLSLFAGQAAIAIENARLHGAAVRRGEELEALLRASRTVTAGLDLQATLEQIAAEASRIAHCQHVKLLLVDKEAQVLRIGVLHETPTPDGFPLPVGTGLSGMVAKTGQPLYIADSQNDPRSLLAAFDRKVGFRTYLGLPIRARDEVLGVLTINTMEPREYTAEVLAYLGSFADHAAIAIENARLHGAAVRRGEELEALLRATRALMSEVDLQQILDRIVTEAAGISSCSHVKVLLVDQGARVLRVGALKGTMLPDGFQMPLGTGLSGRVAATGERLFVEDPGGVPENVLAEQDRQTGVATYLGLPIKIRDEVLGVLTFNTTDRHHYTAEELTYLGSFADHAAIALEKARLFQELNQSYAHLQWAQDELIRAEKLRALGQMSAGIAHDLNNMLAAILGQVELLRLRAQDPEIQESLRMLETAATEGAQVVRRLQDFARQRGRSPLAPVDLVQAVTEALEITRPRWRDEVQRQGRVIDIQLQLAGIPPILGYAPEVREVLTNVILNAVDAMPQGGTLSLLAQNAAADAPSSAECDRQAKLPLGELPGWVELSVTDTGIGMSEEVRKRVFDPFFTTKGGRGTGLGLSVAYGIMERHKGHITMRSVSGQGTTVGLRFQSAPRAPRKEEPQPQRTLVASKRLLVIDDDPMVRRTIASLLRATGHQVAEADGGAAGIARLEEEAVDVVLTDLGMPEVTGWDVARAARKRAPRLPVILLTGWGEHGAGEPPAAGLVDRVLAKPVRLEELLAVIEEVTKVE